ncbi:MAG: DoxX family protein [Bradymonadia bacterium]
MRVGSRAFNPDSQETLVDAQPTKAQKIAGIILTVLVGLMLLPSAGMKLSGAQEVVEGFAKFGFPPGALMPIGIVELLSAVLLLIPRTNFLGAILVTGYMGGAICTHVRVSEPFFVQFSIGVVAWVGYGLRNPGVIKAAFGLQRAG